MQHFILKFNGSSYFHSQDEDGTPRFTDVADLAFPFPLYEVAEDYGKSKLATHGLTCFQIEKLYV